MAQPTFLAQLDWDDSGTFVQATDDITDRVLTFRWSRGRNADFSGEAMGQASLTLRNDDGYVTNLMDPAGTAALIPGRPLWVTGTYGGTAYGVFYGRVERVSADPVSRTVTVEAYDPLRALSETPVVVAATTIVTRTARDYRIAVLDDAWRGNRNLVPNPSFETDLTGWSTATYNNATYARSTAAAYSGSASLIIGSGGGWGAEAATDYSPITYGNTTYRASAYVRAVSGTVTVSFGIGFGTLGYGDNASTFTIGTAWTRITTTYTPPYTRRPADNNYAAPVYPAALYIGFYSGLAGTAYVDAVQVTRGPELRTYSDTGSGRWSSWIGNGNLDGGTEGWSPTYTNFITNGNFESNTTGWSFVASGSATGPGTASASGSIASSTAAAFGGTAGMRYITPASGFPNQYFTQYPITGTFKANATYRFSAWAKRIDAPTNATLSMYLYSSGNPALGSASGNAPSIGTAWTFVYGFLTMGTADRTDMVVRFGTGTSAGTYAMDAVSVTRQGGSRTYLYYAPDSGPGGNASGTASLAISTAVVKYGAQTMAVTTPAGTAEGAVYDLYHLGGNLGPFPYTASLWLYPGTAVMPYKAGFATTKADGTWEETTATGTATANTWTQITMTRTPTAAYQSFDGRNVVYVTQTDSGTARTFYVDGVRLIPGTASDEFEAAEWNVAAGSAEGLVTYPQATSFAGNAVAQLTTLNDVASSRHWVEPQGTAPYYRYTSQDRTTFAALSTAETYANDFRLLDAQELDRSQIVNVVPVTWSSATVYVSDGDSVGRYGPRPVSTLDLSDYLVTAAAAQERGSAVLVQYAAPRGRPTLEAVNRFPSLLARDVGDLVTVTYPALGITARDYTVLTLEGEVRSGGAEWVVRYGLEEYPY